MGKIISGRAQPFAHPSPRARPAPSRRYVYLHLISLMNGLYLVTFAAYKGMRFHPDETVAFGLVFPFCSTLIAAVTCSGLLAVGTLLANPLGSDVTDFAVLSFLRSCSANSRQVITEQLEWADCHARTPPQSAMPSPADGETPPPSYRGEVPRALKKGSVGSARPSRKGVSFEGDAPIDAMEA